MNNKIQTMTTKIDNMSYEIKDLKNMKNTLDHQNSISLTSEDGD